jgi:RNA polymerase sigma-70 factor (ECF subfamily)
VNNYDAEPGLDSPRARQRAAFAALVKEYQQPLGGYLLNLLGEVEAARVLTEQTFVCAYRDYVARPSGQAVRPWLYRTATRLACQHLRITRHAATPGAFRLVRLVPAPAAPSASRERALVRAALRDLPMGERAALLLCDFEQLPDVEAAAILGMSTTRLRRRLERTRAHFRLTYAEHDAMAGFDRAG